MISERWLFFAANMLNYYEAYFLCDLFCMKGSFIYYFNNLNSWHGQDYVVASECGFWFIFNDLQSPRREAEPSVKESTSQRRLQDSQELASRLSWEQPSPRTGEGGEEGLDLGSGGCSSCFHSAIWSLVMSCLVSLSFSLPSLLYWSF